MNLNKKEIEIIKLLISSSNYISSYDIALQQESIDDLLEMR